MRYGSSIDTIPYVGEAQDTGGGGGGTQGPPGPAGADGKSAFQIAVDNGFAGTEAQWLASLVGADGTAGADGAQGPAGADGAAGSIGPQGPQGPAGANGSEGKSAFQVAVDNGFSGTEAEWLASLQASAETITSDHVHNIAELSVGDSFFVADTGVLKIWKGVGFVELGKALEPLAVDAIETDNSFADDASSGSAGDFKYSDVDGDHLYIHDGTEWHNINGA